MNLYRKTREQRRANDIARRARKQLAKLDAASAEATRKARAESKLFEQRIGRSLKRMEIEAASS